LSLNLWGCDVFADELVWGQASEAFEPAREVIPKALLADSWGGLNEPAFAGEAARS
jgi:hypothetical protein